jgi:hypothetical protein
MGARSTHNRKPTEPFGENYDDVLKRAKAWFYKYGYTSFYITKYGNTYSAFSVSSCFKNPDDARFYVKYGRFWIETTEEEAIKYRTF